MKKIFTIISLLLLLIVTVNAQTPQLWGMTAYGGSTGYAGTIFKINGDGSGWNLVQNCEMPTGVRPLGNLIKGNDGKLYGMTLEGGTHNNGVIFNLDPANNSYTVLHDFDSVSGMDPIGSLFLASNGKMYGMTSMGGLYMDGIIFSFDPSNNSFNDLKDFNGADGAAPNGNLMQASNGLLYGMTQNGGGYGNIFSFDISANNYTVLYNFNDTTGAMPMGSLIQANNGLLYGMTSSGGSILFNNSGTFFSFDINTNTFSLIWVFGNGENPNGSLLQASNGKLYGMCPFGGPIDGYIFTYTPYDTIINVIYDFSQVSGMNPTGTLIEGSNGKLYGMTPNGGNVTGTVFSLDTATNVETVLFNFDLPTGYGPNGDLLEVSPNSSCSANFTLTPDTTMLHHYIAINMATGVAPLRYYWSWGDSTYDTIPYPSHTYADTGIYTICLTILDSTGCSGTYCDSSFNVMRTSNMMAYVNVFGPSGINNPKSIKPACIVYPNPANNTITINDLRFMNYDLRITDILGNEVYHQAINNSSQTTIDISECCNGVYFYQLRNEKETMRGKFVVEK